MTVSIASLPDAIAERGYCVIPAWLPPGAVAALGEIALARVEAGEFRAARVGRTGRATDAPELRGDLIQWLEPDDPAVPVRETLERFDAFRRTLNEQLFLGLAAFEAHFAVYPPGAFYARHVDRFRDDDARVVSAVLYLNDAWRETDGGCLRLYDGEALVTEVAPAGGALVVFLSDRFPHEVLPARRPRLSLTGWFRRRQGP